MKPWPALRLASLAEYCFPHGRRGGAVAGTMAGHSWYASLLVLWLGCVLPVAAAAPNPVSDIPTVSVAAGGKVEVVPDQARVSVAFTQRGAKSAPVADLVKANNRRAAPALAYIKKEMGTDATVQVVPNIQEEMEYDRQAGTSRVKGRLVTTTIEITVRGEEAIKKKLGLLFDAANIPADRTSGPDLGLSEEGLAAAQEQAYAKAVQAAVRMAKAHLLPGEELGRALARGNVPDEIVPRYGLMKAQSAPMSVGSSDSSQALVEGGTVTVQVHTRFKFEVKGPR
ncbi:MAG: SIMPL domain-containing protein [Elusimicrobia bacterium]|nr:SIMPL domain-containing protein [Elusimicrobiota bacterium]